MRRRHPHVAPLAGGENMHEIAWGGKTLTSVPPRLVPAVFRIKAARFMLDGTYTVTDTVSIGKEW